MIGRHGGLVGADLRSAQARRYRRVRRAPSAGRRPGFGLGREDLLYDDIVVAEYLTFIEIMQQADVQLFIQ